MNEINKNATGVGKKFLNLFSQNSKPNKTVTPTIEQAPVEQKQENKTVNKARLNFKQTNLQNIMMANNTMNGEQQ